MAMEERRGRSLDQNLNARIREKLHSNTILRRSGMKKELWRFEVYEDDRPPNICPIKAGKFQVDKTEIGSITIDGKALITT